MWRRGGVQEPILEEPQWPVDVCCAFRDGILHTLVVTSGYLSNCCLSIISNQSAHSPLTSDINKAFSSTQLLLTGYFLFFGPFSVNPRDGCAWQSLKKNPHLFFFIKKMSVFFILTLFTHLKQHWTLYPSEVKRSQYRDKTPACQFLRLQRHSNFTETNKNHRWSFEIIWNNEQQNVDPHLTLTFIKLRSTWG